MRKTLVAVAAAVAITVPAATLGTAYWISQNTIRERVALLKKAVVKDIYDPDAARFRSVQLQGFETFSDRLQRISPLMALTSPKDTFAFLTYAGDNDFTLCGEINGKNAFGAYIGYKQFYITGRGEDGPLIDLEDDETISKQLCDVGKKRVIYTEPS